MENAEQQQYGWYEDSKRNYPQSNSVAAGFVIFISAGMSLAMSIGFGPYPYGSHIQMCWFVAVIIGAGISANLAHYITKRVFNNVASILVIINGVLYITEGKSTFAIILARYCDGIAFGLTLIPTILAASEQSVKRFRGRFINIEQYGLAIGSFVITAFTSSTNGLIITGQNPRWHGIFAVCCGLLSLLVTFTNTLESPVFNLRNNNENEAISVLARLQKPKTITNETVALLHESKALLEEDIARGISINISNGWIPMFKMILLRCFVSISFSYPLTAILLQAVILDTFSSPYLYSCRYFFVYVYVLMRLIGVKLSTYFLDTIGRRIPCSISLVVSGVVLIIIAIQDLNIMNASNAETVLYLLLIYQLFSGIIAPTSTCYLGEAFSVSVKPYFIFTTIFTENILQIILGSSLLDGLSITKFCYTLGGLQFIYGIFFNLIMPETSQTTLRQALKMF